MSKEGVPASFRERQSPLEVKRYLPDELDRDLSNQLIQQLSFLAAKGFTRGEKPEQDLVEDVSNHLRVSDRITVVWDGEEVAAFIFASLHAFETLEGKKELMYHLEGIIVDPAYHVRDYLISCLLLI